MISIELLRKQKILQSLDDSILIDLAHHIRFEQFQKRDYIFHKGSIGDSLVLVLSGQLQIVTLSEDNREVGLSFVEAGDYCGELSIIDGLPRSASAIAATDCMVGFLPRAKTRWLFFNDPQVMENLLIKMSAMVRQASQQRSLLGMNRSYSRIYAVLMNTAKQKEGNLTTIDNLPTQQTIATMANVSRETVSRAIHALINQGVVFKDVKRLVVRDTRLLEQLSRGEVEIQEVKKTA